MRIAGHSQVLLPTDIDAEFDGVIAERVRHVADPLELVLLLVERAVAGIGSQRIAELEAAGAVEPEKVGMPDV